MAFPKDILILRYLSSKPYPADCRKPVRKKLGSQEATPSRCARATVATRTEAAPAFISTRLQARAVAPVV
jgi:hypothetical protein